MSDNYSDDSGMPSPKRSALKSDEDQPEIPSFSLASLGLQRVGTKPPPKPPAQPIQLLNARGMPARIRKRNRLFFDDHIINDDKPLRMSLSPKKTPIKLLAGGSHINTTSPLASGNSTTTTNSNSKNTNSSVSTSTVSPVKTPTKVLKKRKGVVSRYMRTEDNKRILTTARHVSSVAGGTPTKTAITTAQLTPKKMKSATTTPTNYVTPIPLTQEEMKFEPEDKRIAQEIGSRLKNLLKLPKAHKWVIYEWFYSFIDKTLLEGTNDFQNCLTTSFPKLHARTLTRAEWRKIRSLIGKPRRCSLAFFEEERRILDHRRQKIRYLQTRKSGDIKDITVLRDMPEKIPLPLPIGTKVTARLRGPQDGIFSGTVDAFDSLTSTYRVAFDRPGLGTHSIPDVEIVSENFDEMLSLQSITKDFRPNLISVYNKAAERASLGNKNSNTTVKCNSGSGNVSGVAGLHNVRSALKLNLGKNDPLLGQEVIDSPYRNPVLQKENINGYPIKLLETMVRLRHALTIKKSKLNRLSEMNNEAELRTSQQGTSGTHNSSPDEAQLTSNEGTVPIAAPLLSEEFQRRYASIVISLEKMNRDMQDYLNELQSFSTELTRDPTMQAMLVPTYLREKCREAAEHAVQRKNQNGIQNKNLIELIKNLTTVLIVTSHLKNDANTAHVSKVLDGCIEEVKSTLHGENVETFQKHVKIHLHHIHSIFGQTTANTTINSNISGHNVSMSCLEEH